jgi:hypothetical protein
LNETIVLGIATHVTLEGLNPGVFHGIELIANRADELYRRRMSLLVGKRSALRAAPARRSRCRNTASQACPSLKRSRFGMKASLA